MWKNGYTEQKVTCKIPYTLIICSLVTHDATFEMLAMACNRKLNTHFSLALPGNLKILHHDVTGIYSCYFADKHYLTCLISRTILC